MVLEAKYVADRAREQEYWAQCDERYERESKARNDRFELLLNLVTGCPSTEMSPVSNPSRIIDSSTTTSIHPDIPNIENATTVHTTNTVHTTDTTNTNNPTINNYYDNIDHEILLTEHEGTINFF